MSKIRLDYVSNNVLPELGTVLEEMIRLYNESPNDSKIYLKLNSAQTNTSSSRYQLYPNRATLLEAIWSNCPLDCLIINE